MEIYKTTGTLILQFIWSYFKYREVLCNLKQGPVLFIPPARSTIDDTNSVCIFVDPYFGVNFIIQVNLADQYLNSRILRKLEVFSVVV